MKLTLLNLLALVLVLIPAHLCVAFTPRQKPSTEAGTEPAPTGSTFSPVWLKDISVPKEEEVHQVDRNESDHQQDHKEVLVQESEYVNANSEPLQLEESTPSEEIIADESTSSWQAGEEEEEDEDDQELEDDDVIVHELMPAASGPDPESVQQADVEVREWNDRPPHAIEENDIIDSANSVSAPWYDVMAIGLPPSVAYNWQFLMDLSAKLRTAPKGVSDPRHADDNDDYNARLKYMLTKIQDTQGAKMPPMELDPLKQKHLLKARLNSQTKHEDDMLAWAWRRAAHKQN